MKQMLLIKSVIVFAFLSFVGVANAAPSSQLVPYYGEEFYRDLKAGTSGEALQNRIKTVMRNYHMLVKGSYDQIVKACPQGQGRCYAHTAIGYNAARVFLMGNYYLVKEGNQYAVRDVYCNTERGPEDFKSSQPSPGKIPNNTVINVEHTWPQSKFTRRFPDDVQKSDLHHLFPTDSQLNAIRGNHPFGEVTKDLMDLKCPESRFGIGTSGSDEVFEPPQNHRGNVARALFYFSLRYDLPIDPQQEQVLRKWNQEDPVDEDEMKRNIEIYKVQGNRNPFVDFPELADRLNDF